MGNWNQVQLRVLCWPPSTVWVNKWRKIWMRKAIAACGTEEELLVGKSDGSFPHELRILSQLEECMDPKHIQMGGRRLY